MKDCTRHAPLLDARPGELSEAEATALADHLAGCEACQGRAADLAATEGLVAEALLARAAQRDFAPFVDEVMEKVYGRAPARGGVLGWLAGHWRAATATVVPALAAAALFLYVQRDGETGSLALVELHAEGVTTVLQTSDGPVVLLSPQGTGS